MLSAIRNWLTPLTEPREGKLPVIPEDLPAKQTVTYNPSLQDLSRASEYPTPPLPVAPRWRVRREKNETEDTIDWIPDELPVPVPVPEAPTAGYTLHKVIARGGFGEIWEATQEVLSRVVAVKRLRQDLIDYHRGNVDTLRRLEVAFRQEALVAAYLEHPNILPVHDLGVDPSGHLLLATKLVRGKTWDELVERDKALPLDVFLDIHLPILESVAKAVAFAHARGIVHRDLKPPQVMVGEFGEVLLMDWGIAIFTQDSPELPAAIVSAIGNLAPTRLTASNPAGTVAYMAPEQTETSVTNIGPWTDIYLLGGILYELLTGHPPHDGESRHQSFYQAALGLVTSPWEVAPDRDLPSQLAALAMACLEPRSKDRLASVDEFIRLLGEYRTGASRRREAAELLGRVTAHKSEVFDYKPLSHDLALVMRALSLWPGHAEGERLHEILTLTYARLALKNHDLKLARLQAERLPETNTDRQVILREVDHLEDEQAQARERLDQAYMKARAAHARADRLVTFLLDDLHTSLKAVNRLDLMGKVGREALDYFDSLAEEEPTAVSIAKRATACRNIGDVFRDQGNLEGAGSAFRTFQELAQRLVALDSEDTHCRRLLASSCERLSGLEYLRGNLDESLRLLEQGLVLTTDLLNDVARDPEDEYLDAKLTHQKGIVLWRRRQLDAAHALQHASLSVLQHLAETYPEETDYRQSYGWNLSTLGNVYRDKGDLPEAIRLTQLGLDIRSDLSRHDPDNKALQDDVCWNLTNLALLREYTGDFTSALATFAEAGKVRRRLVAGDPTNTSHRNRLTFILSSQGRNLYGLARYEEAVVITRESCAISRDIVAADPSNIHELGSHALNLGYAGTALFQAGHHAEAREVLKESKPAALRVLKAVPENGVFQNALCQALIVEGLLARLDGDSNHARTCWEEALALLDRQFWRRTTGQGMGMHLELSLYLGRLEDALADAEDLRKNKWMMPRWEELLRAA